MCPFTFAYSKWVCCGNFERIFVLVIAWFCSTLKALSWFSWFVCDFSNYSARHPFCSARKLPARTNELEPIFFSSTHNQHLLLKSTGSRPTAAKKKRNISAVAGVYSCLTLAINSWINSAYPSFPLHQNISTDGVNVYNKPPFVPYRQHSE